MSKNAKRKKENYDKHIALTFMSYWLERERDVVEDWKRYRSVCQLDKKKASR